MKLPRDMAGREVARALEKAFGYQVTRPRRAPARRLRAQW